MLYSIHCYGNGLHKITVYHFLKEPFWIIMNQITKMNAFEMFQLSCPWKEFEMLTNNLILFQLF